MSLIFTNSSQREYEDENDLPTTYGIERPFAYRNNLKNTLKIEKDSEVAVQSVEFNRKSQMVITDDNYFSYYLGQQLSNIQSLGSTTSIPMPVSFKGINSKISRKELATELQKLLRKTLGKPEYFNQFTVGTNATETEKFDFTSNTKANVEIVAAGGMGQPTLAYDATARTNLSWFVDWTRMKTDIYTVGGDFVGFTISDSGNTFTRDRATTALGPDTRLWEEEESCAINRNYPISTNAGSCVFTFVTPSSTAVGDISQFDIGFTRPTTFANRDNLQSNKPWTSGFGVVPPVEISNGSQYPLAKGAFPFFDYVASFRYSTDDATTRQLRLYQVMNGDNGTSGGYEPQMVEVKYYQTDGHGGTNAPATILNETDFITNSWTHLKWTFTGELIKLEVGDDLDAYTLVCDSGDDTGRDKKGVWKSVDQNQWTMYPKINLSMAADTMKIDSYDSAIAFADRNSAGQPLTTVNADAYNYPMDGDDFMNQRGGQYQQGSSWWDRRYLFQNVNSPDNDDEYFGRGLDVNIPVAELQEIVFDRRWNMNPYLDWSTHPRGDEDPPIDSPWIGMDASATEAIKYVGVIIATSTSVNSSDAEDIPISQNDSQAGIYAGTGTNGGNSAKLLGFLDGNPVQGIAGTSSDRAGANPDADPLYLSKWVVTSDATVQFNPRTLLVSCPTLTHQSYNLCLNAPSKFLYHCPRFTNTGLSHGRMFFEPPTPMYVRMNNQEDIYLQDLEINLTDKNGQPATDLQGATSVVLHIRKSKD